MLRFAEPVHVQIGHGESDKGSSVSNQHKAYDLTFVGGAAGRDRLQTGAARLRRRGAHPARSAARSSTTTIPAHRTGRRGRAAGLVRADLGGRPAEHRVRVAGQPRGGDRRGAAGRPDGSGSSTGRTRGPAGPRPPRARPTRPSAAGSAQAGDRHLIDEGEYGWQWRVRRRLRHRHLRGRVRLAGDREAAGDHRAGASARPTGRRRRCWTDCRCCAPTEAGTVLEVLRTGAWALRSDAGSAADRTGARTTSVTWPIRPAATGSPRPIDRRWRWRAAAEQRYKPAQEVHVVVGRLRWHRLRFFVPSDSAFGRPKKQPADRTGQRKADHGRRPQPARHPAHRVRRGLGHLDHAVDHQQRHDDDRQIPPHSPRVCVAAGLGDNSGITLVAMPAGAGS